MEEKIKNQCLVSILKDGKVFLKLTAGCNVEPFLSLLEWIESTPEISGLSLYQKAESLRLGCEKCLLVMDEITTITKSRERIPERYRLTFHKAGWNPRWREGDPVEGEAGNVRIINKDSGA